MKMPKGMQLSHKELERIRVKSTGEIALLLKRSLYGLKQAGRLCSKLIHSRLHENGFNQCTTDMCLYYKQEGNNWAIVGVYVDDLIGHWNQSKRGRRFLRRDDEIVHRGLGLSEENFGTSNFPG